VQQQLLRLKLCGSCHQNSANTEQTHFLEKRLTLKA